MATQQSSGSESFYKQLGRMYGTYTGAFIAFIILCAILERLGTPNRVVGYLFVFFTLAVYAVIGVMTRTAQLSEYYVAGRRVPAFYNGMATGADWMSAASFVGESIRRAVGPSTRFSVFAVLVCSFIHTCRIKSLHQPFLRCTPWRPVVTWRVTFR